MKTIVDVEKFHKISDLKSRSQIKLFNLLNDRKTCVLMKACDDLASGNIYLTEQFKVVTAASEKVWLMDPFDNRSWRFWFHSLIMIEHLLNGYEKLHSQKYLDKCLDFLWSWAEGNCPASNSEMAWHDHSTALRLIMICKLFESWRVTCWNDKTAYDFCHLVEIHCNKLSDPSFYMENHNHGLDQDIALYVGATVFSHMDKAQEWKELSLVRFWAQLEKLFAADGSYLEHTPSYSALLCDRLIKFMHFLEQQEAPGYEHLNMLINGQFDFLTHILQPDGQIPPIGDGNCSPLNAKSFGNVHVQASETLKYLTSRGQEGMPPDKPDKIFPIGGYAMMRNKWHYDKETCQMIFFSSFHSRVHKHHDDLSITLFGHGQPILMDAGKYNYNYDSPERQFVVSSRAHNTVVANDADTETTRLNVGKSGLTGYCFNEDFSFVSGIHRLYKDVIHNRMVLYLKPRDFLVMDCLQSGIGHKYQQIFNFHPSIECNMVGLYIMGDTPDGLKVSLSPLLEGNELDVSLVKGEKSPLRGWCSLEYGRLIPAWSGAYELQGQCVRFATHINLFPSGQRLTGFSWKDSLIEMTWKGKKIKITEENKHTSCNAQNHIVIIKQEEENDGKKENNIIYKIQQLGRN